MSKDKEIIYEMTEEMRKAGAALGWTEDDMMPVGKHKFRRSRHINKEAKPKEKISINLDADILEYFRQKAGQEDAAPYQTQINFALRRVMESEKKSSSADEIENLLNDKKWLKKLKEKLASV